MASLLDLVDGLNNSEKRQRQLQLDYWREREEEQKKHNITDLDEYNRELDKIYSAMITDCQNQINDWYMRYATKEGISIADAKKRVSTADQKYYAEKAKEYVANKDFSDKANSEMRLYNLTMKVNRMELLKANLGLAMTGGYSDIEKLTGEFLDKKTLEELKRQAVILGKGVDGVEKHADDIVNASFKNATFSDRLWTDMDSLRQSINVQVQRSLIRGLNPVEIARGFMPELRNDVKKARFATERLARTEMSRVLTDAQMDSFKANGYDEYMIICERTACALCRPFDGQHFPLDEMEVGYNASPFHPNCVLPDTVIFAPDAEKLIRSEYLGDIVEFVTSDGTRLSVTPNHIVLTSRGWVRAKNLVKGDKIVRYCGNVGNGVHAEPTNDNGSVSVENLFTAVIEAGGGSSCTVPSSPIDLKGDVVANSEIDIVNINSELRNKLDSSLRQLISDCSLVWTSETLEGVLPRQGSVALLLMGIGLASDGVMSGFGVLDTLFGSESADSKLPRSRNVSEYNARILKTLVNDASADIIGFGEFLDALTAVVAGNNLSDIKIDDSSVGDHNSVALESSADSSASDTEFGGNLTNGCSRIISVDNIVDINVRYFSGHVYDTSCMSTLYIANSIISSNCLCSQAPYMDRDELEQMIREIEAERGDVPVQQEEQQKAEKEIKKAESNALLNKINAIKSKLNGNTPKYADLKEAGKAVIPEVEKAVAEAKKTIDSTKAEELWQKRREIQKQITALEEQLWFGRNGLTIEQREEYIKVKKKLERQVKKLDKEREAVKAVEAVKVPDAVKSVIGQVREMGIPEDADIDYFFYYSKSKVLPALKEAYNRYPKDWVQSSLYKNNGDMRHLNVKKVNRGYYSYYGSEIAISGNSFASQYETSTHELGHFFERTVKGLRDSEAEFYKLRTDGEDLEWLGKGYRRDEKTRKDNFVSPYMGKDYGGDAYELVSMGFEYAYTHPEILLKDPDMAEWIYGMLALL